MPLDTIADPTPAVGYAGDLGNVLALASAVASRYGNDDARRKTARRPSQ